MSDGVLPATTCLVLDVGVSHGLAMLCDAVDVVAVGGPVAECC